MNQQSLTAAPPILRGAVPFLGMSSALARDPLAVFSRARALGDVVRLAVPGRHAVVVVAHPAHIRRVLQENYGNYRRTPFHDRLKIVLGDGLVTSEGERWHRQRQLLQPAFRAERIRRFIPIMSELSASCAVRWDQAAKTGQQLDISREMSELALGIVVRCMFDQETDADDVGIGAAVHVAQGWLASRFWSVAPNWTERLPTLANRRFRRALATVNGTVERIITRRLRAANRATTFSVCCLPHRASVRSRSTRGRSAMR
jgi:cytochrome P450